MTNHQGPSDMHDLEPLLARAAHAVRGETLPDDAISRVIDRARRLDLTLPDSSLVANDPATPVRSRSTRWIVAWSASGAAALAASLLFAILFFSDGTSVLFAEMLAALAARPWVHATTTYSGGGQTATSESWVSTADRCAAMKFGDHYAFIDMETGISLAYDAKDGTINRTAWLHQGKERASEAQLPGLLDNLIADKADSRQLFPGERVIKAERNEDEQDGKKWLVYLIHLERIDNTARNRTVRIRLDRATQLPQSWEERQANGTVAVTRFDYPDTGPRNIYELGVPKTATLIDRVPKGDLARIIAAQRADRKRFDPYDAIVVQQIEGAPTRYDYLINLGVRRVRRKGGQYRVDRLISAKEGLTVPTPETDMQQWWKENRDRYWSEPEVICDGETTYIYNSTVPNERLVPGKKPNLSVVEFDHYPIQPPTDDPSVVSPQMMPEQCCRPQLWPSDKNREFEVDPEAKDGPPGTMRVIATMTKKPHAGETIRFWFDPDRAYILRKRITRVFEHGTDELAYPDTEQFDEFARSPGGIWYPQLIRRTTSDSPQSRQATRFYVDFEAELGTDLFRPVPKP